ncbi:MAG: PilZ domain-containing protein [Spirochaetales bacterium]|nr:PilZ domain-containing protein [Spirochaetales bacterium]
MSETRHIGDVAQIARVVDQLYMKGEVNLSLNGSLMAVTLTHLDGGRITAVYAREVESAPERLLRLLTREHQMVLQCRVVARNSDRIEELEPFRLHLQNRAARGERAAVPEKKVLYVTGLVSLDSFIDRLSSINHKRDTIIEYCIDKLKQKYDFVRIELRRSYRMEARMRLMDSLKKPIFAPDRTDADKWQLSARVAFEEQFIGYGDYRSLDQYGNIPAGMQSEIDVPLSYRNIFLYGFIQVFSTHNLQADDYIFIERYARSLEKELESQGLLPSNPEKSPVVDLNLGGIGIMHPHNSSVLRDFQVGDEVIFDLHFPRMPALAFPGVVANARSLEKAHRIGIQFKDLKEEQTSRLQATLRELGKNAAP